MAFCKYCGKQIPEGGSCDCAGAKAAEEVKDTVESGVNTAENAVSEVKNEAAEAVSNVAEKAADAAQNAEQKAAEAVSGVADGAANASAILADIIDTPISPELVPAGEDGQIVQKTEDLVGPYELHDFFLYNFFRFGFGPKKIFFLAKKANPGEMWLTHYSPSLIHPEEYMDGVTAIFPGAKAARDGFDMTIGFEEDE